MLLLVIFFCMYFFCVKFLVLPRYFRKYKFWLKRKNLFANNVAQTRNLSLVLVKTQERFYFNNVVAVLTFFK
jgi:hypothetical protein